MVEEWRDIEDYEGLYQISNLGKVKSLPRKVQFGVGYRITDERILKPHQMKNGYMTVGLKRHNKPKYMTVHRLVAEAFIPNPDNKPCIDHIDGDRKNNSVENLRWCTHKENCNNPITRQRISEAMKNRIFSEETRHKMSIARKGKYNTKISKTVIQIDKESGEILNEYPSINEIYRQLGYSPSRISNCCRGIYKQYKGFIWKYAS